MFIGRARSLGRKTLRAQVRRQGHGKSRGGAKDPDLEGEWRRYVETSCRKVNGPSPVPPCCKVASCA